MKWVLAMILVFCIVGLAEATDVVVNTRVTALDMDACVAKATSSLRDQGFNVRPALINTTGANFIATGLSGDYTAMIRCLPTERINATSNLVVVAVAGPNAGDNGNRVFQISESLIKVFEP